jgi:hypothetical protein
MGLLPLAALADKPILPASAFVVPQACRVDPYGDSSPEERETMLDRGCGMDRLKLDVDGPRPQATSDSTPLAPVKLGADQVMTRSQGPLTTSLRMGWQGLSASEGRLQTEHALLAAASMLRLSPDLAVDMNVGRDLGANLRTRTTVTGLWRATDERLIFAEVAPEGGSLVGAVGLRWWLVAKRLVLDVAARRPSDGAGIEPRVGLALLQFGN